MKLEVAFGTPKKQIIIPICVKDDLSVIDVINISGIALEFPEYDFLDISSEPCIGKLNVGIFGKKIDISTYQLKDNDRIEIYRPLNKTPNQKRLERAKHNETK